MLLRQSHDVRRLQWVLGGVATTGGTRAWLAGPPQSGACQVLDTPETQRQSFKEESEPVWPSGHIVQELCESRGGCPGLSVLTSLLVSVDVKLY